MWREFLPEIFQKQPIKTCILELAKNSQALKISQELELPSELIASEEGIKKPDPDKLFPGARKKLEKKLNQIYITERWVKRQKELDGIMRIRKTFPLEVMWTKGV
ncbi:MAG: hypothetical protein P0S93_02445 [Candidatus Neptunochlamydia sp.]|nr:hypothetical protein [Candidatus Neptunochlamydia sp.]